MAIRAHERASSWTRGGYEGFYGVRLLVQLFLRSPAEIDIDISTGTAAKSAVCVIVGGPLTGYHLRAAHRIISIASCIEADLGG